MPKIEFKKDERRSDPIRNAKPYLLNPGGFEVHVDGKQWGRLDRTTHGRHGALYALRQICDTGASPAFREVPSDVNPRFQHGRTMRRVLFEAWSDKMYNLRRKENPAVPLMDRLHTLVVEAIACKALRDPAEVKKRADDQAAKREAERAAAEAAKFAEFEARARDALALPAAPAPLASPSRARVDSVIAAMRWAQSQ